MFHPCFLFSLFRIMSVSCGQRVFPGVGGRRCGAFMSPIFRDPHPTCARCRGIKCTADMTCDICKDWFVVQWRAFLKRHRKKCPSGSALPPVSQTPLPWLLRKPDALSFPLGHSPLLLRGVTARGKWRVSFTWVLARSPLPPPSFRSVRGWGWGGAARALASVGTGDSAASSLPGEGVVGSSYSQESPLLADPVRWRLPVLQEVIIGHTLKGGEAPLETALTLHAYLPLGVERPVKSIAVPSRGARAWSRESLSRSTDRSRSRGRKHSCRDSSRSPSARVQSRRSRSSNRYRDRRVHSQSDRSQSRRLHSWSSDRRRSRDHFPFF